MLTTLDRALKPISTAAEGGAGVTVPVRSDRGPRVLAMALDTGSQRVVDSARNHRLRLAGEMADEQIKTIHAVLQDSTLNGTPPATTARLIRQTIGLTPVQAGHVMSYRRALTALDPNALNRQLRDKRFDATVRRAIESKAPIHEDHLNRMVDAYHRRSIALRAMTIARTEGLRAANNGSVDSIRDFLDQHPDYTVIKTWVATHDARTRPDHMALDGKQVIGLDTPFLAPSGDSIPWPHHPDASARMTVNCRCTLNTTLVQRTGVAQRGFSLMADTPGNDDDRGPD